LGGWRKQHNEKLHNKLYSSPHIIRLIKTRRLRWVGHMACMDKMMIKAYKILARKLNKEDHLGN
jgi:hypothetical protein